MGGNPNDQQQQKQKGGGGGGSGPGISLVSKFDSSTVGSVKDLKKQMVGQAANGIAMLAAIAVGGLAFMFMKDTFGIDDGPAPAQGGGGINSPKQISGAIHQFKSHPDMAEALPKIEAAVGIVKGNAQASAEEKK